jgi:hypothetical protein
MRLVLIAVAALALALPAAAATPPFKASLKTTTTTPIVDQPWRWTVVARDAAGKPLAARLRLQILVGTLVVGCWKGSAMTQCSGANAGDWIPFKGVKRGVLTWPAQSAGVKLTFQAVVNAKGKTVRLRSPVTVKPAG